MDVEVIRELMSLNKELSTQLRAQSHILFGLLKVLPPDNLDKLQVFLEVQAETCTQNESLNESCNAALELIHSLNGEEPDGKNIFEVIQGGKRD